MKQNIDPISDAAAIIRSNIEERERCTIEAMDDVHRRSDHLAYRLAIYDVLKALQYHRDGEMKCWSHKKMLEWVETRLWHITWLDSREHI